MDKGTLASNFSRAKMNKGAKPLVIVESEYDKFVYLNLVRKLDLKLTLNIIYPTQFEDIDEDGKKVFKANNCEFVIEAIEQLQPKLKEDTNNLKYVLGIIDRDLRYYKDKHDWNRVNILDGLFILKYYSIETYFATPYNVKELLWQIISRNLVDKIENILSNILVEIANQHDILYYIGVDAAKEHCEGNINHQAFNRIGDEAISVITRMNEFEKNCLPNIKQVLDLFATQKGVGINHIQQLVNGKWYLYHHVVRIYEEIIKIVPKKGFASHTTVDNLYHQITNMFDENEFSDIIDRLKQLN